MFTQVKLIIFGIIAALLVSAVLGCVWYFKWSQAEIKVLTENNTKLVGAVRRSEAAVKSLTADAEKVSKSIALVTQQYQEARNENNELRGKLSKHNIAYLAASNPKLVSKILTKGTSDAERCFEILSGAPLTENEKSATKKSQSNSSCPRLANPNYKARK